MLMVTQLLNSAVSLASMQHKRMDAEDQSRLVFSRMALDFGKMVKREDVDSIFASNVGNDAFYFYSEAPAGFDSNSVAYNATSGNYLLKNSLSLIGYRINASNQLERLGKALDYDALGNGPYAVFITTPPATKSNPTPTPLPTSTVSVVWASTVGSSTSGYMNGTDTDYHVLSPDVFRMEVCFQLSNGTYSQTHSSQDFSDVSSIIVTVAVLDQTSRQLVTSANLNSAASLLLDPTATDLSTVPPVLPAQKWSSVVDSSSTFAANTGMPLVAANQVRVYQEFFYLNSLR
jgi:hypothetical protein